MQVPGDRPERPDPARPTGGMHGQQVVVIVGSGRLRGRRALAKVANLQG